MLWAAMLMDHAANVSVAGVVMVDMGGGAALCYPGDSKRGGDRARELGEHEKPTRISRQHGPFRRISLPNRTGNSVTQNREIAA